MVGQICVFMCINVHMCILQTPFLDLLTSAMGVNRMLHINSMKRTKTSSTKKAVVNILIYRFVKKVIVVLFRHGIFNNHIL